MANTTQSEPGAVKPESANSAASATSGRQNPLAFVGFVTSCVGSLLTLGVLAPVGFAICLLAIRRQPRGYAVAGLVVGAAGMLVFGGLVYSLYITYWHADSDDDLTSEKVMAPLRMAQQAIESMRGDDETVPERNLGQQVIDSYHDRWGRRMFYVRGDSKVDFAILSLGADGEPGTEDDLIVDSTRDD